MTELGKRLKDARLEKGMSIEDLQEKTKIQKRYLLGIEEGNYSIMPGPFYVRAFIKQYCEAVGLDPEEIFEQYKSDIPSTHRDDLPEQLSRVQSRKSVPVNHSKFLEMLPRILIIAFVLGALFLLWYLLPNFTSKDPAPNNENGGEEEIRFETSDELKEHEEEPAGEEGSDDDSETAEEEEEPEQEEGSGEEEQENDDQEIEISVVESAGKNTVYEVKNVEKVELKIVSTGRTWISVENGERQNLFNGTLVQGGEESKTFDFTDEDEAYIVVGNSAETEIYINDKKLEFAIPPSQQVAQNISIRFAKDSE